MVSDLPQHTHAHTHTHTHTRTDKTTHYDGLSMLQEGGGGRRGDIWSIVIHADKTGFKNGLLFHCQSERVGSLSPQKPLPASPTRQLSRSQRQRQQQNIAVLETAVTGAVEVLPAVHHTHLPGVAEVQHSTSLSAHTHVAAPTLPTAAEAAAAAAASNRTPEIPLPVDAIGPSASSDQALLSPLEHARVAAGARPSGSRGYRPRIPVAQPTTSSAAATLAAIPDHQESDSDKDKEQEQHDEEPTGDPREAHFNKAPSRPASPGEQIMWMANIDLDEGNAAEASERDQHNFDYYMNNEVPGDQLADLEHAMIRFDEETKTYYPVPLLKEIAAKTGVPKDAIDDANLQSLVEEMTAEAKTEYRESQKRAVVEYLLQDPNERARLKIDTVGQPFSRRLRTVRAPVPWSSLVESVSIRLVQKLNITNPVSQALLDMWASSYSDLRFMDVTELREGGPLHVHEFVGLIAAHRTRAQRILQEEWVPSCVAALMDRREHYMHLLHDPRNPARAAQRFEHFFRSVAALMCVQLRSAVESTLLDLCTYFEEYRGGNNFSNIREGHTWGGTIPLPAMQHSTVAASHIQQDNAAKGTAPRGAPGGAPSDTQPQQPPPPPTPPPPFEYAEYTDLLFTQPQALILRIVDGGNGAFELSPSLAETRKLLHGCCGDIIDGSKNVQKVEASDISFLLPPFLSPSRS